MISPLPSSAPPVSSSFPDSGTDSAHSPHPSDPTGPGAFPHPHHPFAQKFDVVPLSSRWARRIAGRWLAERGVAPDSEAAGSAAVIVAELTANAVAHGAGPAAGFELRLLIRSPGPAGTPRTVRIEVTDAGGGSRPPRPGAVPLPAEDAEHGRGLPLVEALSDRWEVFDAGSGGTTIRAEIDLPD
ncbi:ATP-binding protein [Streptomyces alkaliphilus]|uniref:ATP-binding protein n=1 Tax=Streptomyces alkaliphilus TaxID=1472722 RepID=UPI00117E4914|nr:ATP-binding protein [Streptomyces alkaliphilus]MQS07078.1 ATP-binding protein [Streptomyces alkaliphilus]